MTDHLTNASADASRVSTRREGWQEAMRRMALFELEVDLAATRVLPLAQRAAAAAGLVRRAAERLERWES